MATTLRAIFGALAAIGAFVAACSRTRASEETAIGPRLGESTASGPSDPTAPPPDATGPVGVSSGPISGLRTGTAVAMQGGSGEQPEAGELPAAPQTSGGPSGGVIVAAPVENTIPLATPDAGVPRQDAGVQLQGSAVPLPTPDASTVPDAGTR